MLLISASAQAVELGPNSANITNRYFPAAIGRWSYMLGVDGSFGSAIYDNAVGIEEVNGARIGTQTFNNVKCLKWNHMRTNLNDEDEFVTLWTAQDTQGNVWRNCWRRRRRCARRTCRSIRSIRPFARVEVKAPFKYSHGIIRKNRKETER